jgi:hypothetical protein
MRGNIFAQSSRRFTLAALTFACLLATFPTARAAHPSYWILGRQQPSANVQHVHPQGYAYGWFGASAKPQAARQTGYYGNYRQWTFK